MKRILPLLAAVVASGYVLALAACAGETPAQSVATATTTATNDVATATGTAQTIVTVAQAALAAYKATSNPNAAVVAEATKLLNTAQADITQYGPEAATAIAAAGALSTYLLTAAPGNGVTPASVVTPAS